MYHGCMFNDFDDANYELNARYDYYREAYGQPCRCGTLTWGGDCPACYREEDDLDPVAPVTSVAAAPVDPTDRSVFVQDDEIPF